MIDSIAIALIILYATLFIVGSIDCIIKGNNQFQFIRSDGVQETLTFSDKLKLVIFNPKILGIWFTCGVKNFLFEYEEVDDEEN